MKSSSEPPMESDRVGDKKDPAVFAIQHFCLHDGPGVRSIVFFKGCPLRCKWCQNPESWSPVPELAFKSHLCIGCNTCVDICPQKAILSPGHQDSDLCRLCFSCVEKCPSTAMTGFGSFQTIESIMVELEPEFPYYQSTGGGVTFSGGEPTLFPEFITGLSRRLHEKAIHTTLETCGYFDPDMVMGTPSRSDEKLESEIVNEDFRTPSFLTDIDLVLFDIKLFDEKSHLQFCGKKNRWIKKNLSTLTYLAKEGVGPKLWPRLPLIPGITDTPDNLGRWAELLCRIKLPYLTLVPYHNLAESKRLWLDLAPVPDIQALTDDGLNAAIDILTRHGISCYAPGEENWELAG